jgi:hypothetical protein
MQKASRPMVNVTTLLALSLWNSSGMWSVRVCTVSDTGDEMETVQGHFFATSSSSPHKRELRVQCDENSWVTYIAVSSTMTELTGQLTSEFLVIESLMLNKYMCPVLSSASSIPGSHVSIVLGWGYGCRPIFIWSRSGFPSR